MFGWRSSPEDTLRERTRLATRDLRQSSRKQTELHAEIARIKAAVGRARDPAEERRLVTVLVMKQRQLDSEVDNAMRTQRSMDTMEKSRRLCRRHEDAKALAASMSAMSRGATPTSVARIQETLMTAQSSLEITDSMLSEMDNPAPDEQQTIDADVDDMLEMLGSQRALEVGTSMPSFPALPAVPVASPGDAPPPPHPSMREIEERLERLLTLG